MVLEALLKWMIGDSLLHWKFLGPDVFNRLKSRRCERYSKLIVFRDLHWQMLLPLLTSVRLFMAMYLKYLLAGQNLSEC